MPVESTSDLEALLVWIEERLGALQAAILRGEMILVEAEAAALHRGLAESVEAFRRASGAGRPVPIELRRRLALASARVAAQRESLARAIGALDRAIDVLIAPAESAPVYTADGLPDALKPGGTQA